MTKKLTFQPEYITSRSNQTVVKYAKLSEKKFRDEYGVFLAEGEKLASEAADYASAEAVLVSENALENASDALIATVEKAAANGAKAILLSNEAFAKISTEHSPQGVISVVRSSSVKTVPLMNDGRFEAGKAIVLDCVRDPGNLGTVIRTAAAFGYDRIILHDCADITNPKTLRASMGAVFKVNFSIINDITAAVRELRSTGRRVLAAALADESMTLGADTLLPDDIVVIGNEGHGISCELIAECTAALKIPMKQTTESLNASVAASVIMWEQSRDSI